MGIKASTLARQAGISRSYLDQLETLEGKNPSAEVLYRIADGLHTTMEYLLGFPSLTTGGTASDSEVPWSLKTLRNRRGLSDEEVLMLAKIEINGARPQKEEDWCFLYEAIRRSIEPYSNQRAPHT